MKAFLWPLLFLALTLTCCTEGSLVDIPLPPLPLPALVYPGYLGSKLVRAETALAGPVQQLAKQTQATRHNCNIAILSKNPKGFALLLSYSLTAETVLKP